jgi:NitT/TauT family transport system permease protein
MTVHSGSRASNSALYLMATIVVVTAWYIVDLGSSSPFIPGPVDAVERASEWYARGQLGVAVRETLTVFLVGFIVGCVTSVALATSLVWMPKLATIVEPYVMAVYATPKVALVPLFFIWLGRGWHVGALFVSLGAFAIVFVSTMTGLRSVDYRQLQVLLLMGASRWQVTRLLLLRHSLGYLAAGITVAGPFALVSTLVVEMLQGTRGVGGLLVQAAGFFDAAGVFAATAVASALGLLVTGAANVIAGRASRWRQA